MTVTPGSAGRWGQPGPAKPLPLSGDPAGGPSQVGRRGRVPGLVDQVARQAGGAGDMQSAADSAPDGRNAAAIALDNGQSPQSLLVFSAGFVIVKPIASHGAGFGIQLTGLGQKGTVFEILSFKQSGSSFTCIGRENGRVHAKKSIIVQ